MRTPNQEQAAAISSSGGVCLSAVMLAMTRGWSGCVSMIYKPIARQLRKRKLLLPDKSD